MAEGGKAPVDPPSRHSDDDSGCALEEYTWVPPGLRPDQVSLMKPMLNNKLFHAIFDFKQLHPWRRANK